MSISKSKCRACKYAFIKVIQEPLRVFWWCELYYFECDDPNFAEVVDACNE